jgi:predicted TIM-barrel fold metal-dependent hydrolase
MRTIDHIDTARRLSEYHFLPDPPAAEARYTLISVDDHFVEPPDTFDGRLPRALQEQAPRVVRGDDGADYWLVEGRLEANIGTNSVAGRPIEEWDIAPLRFDEMRTGSWDPAARLHDMDLNGVHASLCFPSMVWGFAGQRFMRMADRDLGLACMRAYNDWIVDAWCAADPERLLACQIPWFHDPLIAAAEVRRNAERGFTSITFSENPENLGLPSIHTSHWDPLLAACEETGTVVNLHVGSSSRTPQPSSDSPMYTLLLLFQVNAMFAAADWLFSGVPLRFPRLKIVLSEGGVGWVPSILDRLDHQLRYQEETLLRDTWRRSDVTPAEVLLDRFWFTSFWDPTAMQVIDRIGADRVMFEVDYPHPDCTWPDAQDRVALQMAGLAESTVAAYTHSNAAGVYRCPLPADLTARSAARS